MGIARDTDGLTTEADEKGRIERRSEQANKARS
jgi:hypothetical protein